MTTTPSPASGTQHQFGYEWERYPEIVPYHLEQFKRWIEPLTIDFFKGKTFLDAGCGMGRNSFWPLKEGAAFGYAVDYDERTIASAKSNLAEFQNCEVRFQSIYELDLEEVVDVAFSIGVIHHVAEPRKAVENMVKALKPGGTFLIWVYGYEGNERYLAVIDPLRKLVTSRIPPFWTRLLAKGMTVALRAYLLFPHEKPYLKMLREISFRQLELIVLDQLIPSIANYWRKDEVMKLVEGLPLTNFRMNYTNGMSWTLVAEKTGG